MDDSEYRRRRINVEETLAQIEIDRATSPDLKREARRAVRIQMIGLFIAGATVITTTFAATWQIKQGQDQVRASSEQFERTLRQSQYSDIVNGLASSSVGVQVNSIRLLVQYVLDSDNFSSPEDRKQAAINTAQVLTTFIQDESLSNGQRGLGYYQDAQPIVIPRAFDQLTDLLENERFSDISLDVSNGDFHGADAPDINPQGAFQAVGADFRRARVSGWDLRRANSPDLRSAFFTCADLRTSELGASDLTGADLTGADLRGADLSETIGLDTSQIRGASIGAQTLLPEGVAPPPQPGWGVEPTDTGGPTLACRDLVDGMTSLPGGAGYSSRYPCAEPGSADLVRLSAEQSAALSRVCEWRADSRLITGVAPPSERAFETP